MSKKIKVFLSLIFLLSVVVTVGIFFDFDFKKLNIISSENKEIIISNITPTPTEEIFTDFIYLSEGAYDLNLPVEKSSFEATFEAMRENYQSEVPYSLIFKLKENEEIKAIFDGKIISILKKETTGEQPNDYLDILFENNDGTLTAIYLIAGESLLEENQQIKAGEVLAKIGKGTVSMVEGNFSLTIFMRYEENKYKPVALEAKIFNRE